MELQIFENHEFGKIRTILDPSGKILFCGSDAAKALGYSDTTNALKQHCKKDGVAFYHLSDSLGRKQRTKFVTEGNLYRLILRSKLPSAEQFEKWVAEIVLPAIRKHGTYSTTGTLNDIPAGSDSAAALFLQLRQIEDRVAEMQPKADYYNALVDAGVLTNIRQTAKELNLPEKLFTYLLVEMEFAYRSPKKLLMPYAFMVNSGYAELKEYTNDKHGGTWLSDYLSNQLGVNMDEKLIPKEKPDCPLIGQDGNIFNLMGIASRKLKENGLTEQATEMWDRITASGSYGEALCIIEEYVNITSAEDAQEQSGSFEMKATDG